MVWAIMFVAVMILGRYGKGRPQGPTGKALLGWAGPPLDSFQERIVTFQQRAKNLLFHSRGDLLNHPTQRQRKHAEFVRGLVVRLRTFRRPLPDQQLRRLLASKVRRSS
jgi:hypothetical protein